MLSGPGPTSEGVCKQEVAWAQQTGIQQHPEWYPGLSAQSRLMAQAEAVFPHGDGFPKLTSRWFITFNAAMVGVWCDECASF